MGSRRSRQLPKHGGLDGAVRVETNDAHEAKPCLTYTVDEVAEMLGISRSATYECIARGEIPAKRLGDGGSTAMSAAISRSSNTSSPSGMPRSPMVRSRRASRRPFALLRFPGAPR